MDSVLVQVMDLDLEAQQENKQERIICLALDTIRCHARWPMSQDIRTHQDQKNLNMFDNFFIN